MRIAVALGLAVCTWTTGALADDMQACSDSYTQAQVLRKDRKLLDAREALRTCAQLTCPGFIHKECAQWLDEVQAAVPSVVAIAQDDAGTNLVDVAVALDGKPLASTLDGRAIDVNPGPHTFTFTTTDGVTVQTQVLVAEGERSKRVVVTIHRAGAAPAAAPAASPGPRPAAASPWSTVGLVTAGVGVAAIATGGVFGIVAIDKQRAANCPGNVCGAGGNEGTLRDALQAANVSTVLFVAGGVLAAGGAALWLLAPRGATEATVQAGAVATPGGGGVVVGGRW